MKKFILFLICLAYVIGFLKTVSFPFVPSVDNKGAEILAFALYVLSFVYMISYTVISFFAFPARSRFEDDY